MTQQWTINGTLTVEPVLTNLDSTATPVTKIIEALPHDIAEKIGVTTIDPQLADTAEFCRQYSVPLSASANCVIITAKRSGEITYAACIALATTHINVNSVVRKYLGARKASFAPMDDAVSLTAMDYGGITPIGLPETWPILIDAAVASEPELVIGGGVRASKLFVSGDFLKSLPGATVVEGLASPR